MLLDLGNINVQELLGGASTGKKITQVVVGTSGTAVTGAETALTSPVVKSVLTVSYLGGGIVQFNAELVAGDPAMTIREVGLINQDGVLCFRKVVPDKVKAAGLTYSINYRIKVQ